MNIDIAEGMKLASKAVEIFPDSPFNHGMLGLAYFKQNKLPEARDTFDKAVKLFALYYAGETKNPNNSASRALAYDSFMLKRVLMKLGGK